MTVQNPYAAPQAAYSPPGPGAVQSAYGHDYVPLRWRTVMAGIAIGFVVLLGFGMHVAQLFFQPALTGGVRTGTPDLMAAAVIGLTAIAFLGASVCAWVLVPVWMHRASSNLRGLGRYGMTFSPGGCAGWFFVPFANLVMPPRAMSEMWRASDPEADQGSWFASKGTPLVAVWWAAWLVAGVISWGAYFAKDSPDVATTIGLISNTLSAVAGVMLIALMRGVSGRQQQAAARLGGVR
ncbi:MAG: DUF4328 domain-containing protein [Polyangiaceae bacterium]